VIKWVAVIQCCCGKHGGLKVITRQSLVCVFTAFPEILLSQLSSCVCDTVWHQRLAYLANWTKFIIPRHNYQNHLGTWETKSFYAKQGFEEHGLKKKVTGCFLTLNDFVNELESKVSDDVLSDIMDIYETYKLQWEYFPPVMEGFQWLWNTFMFPLAGHKLQNNMRNWHFNRDRSERYVHKCSSD
jgi:hypothetical protein